jgi:hypothetical protein
MTSEGLFVVPTTSVMLSYRNAVAGDPFSRIALGPRFDLQNIPGVDLNDGFRGAGLLYDGCIAVATRLGSVVVLRPNFQFAARILLGEASGGRGQGCSLCDGRGVVPCRWGFGGVRGRVGNTGGRQGPVVQGLLQAASTSP